MIQGLRDNLKGTVAIIVVGLMVVPFALFGVDSLFMSDPSQGKVAEVNGEGITEISLARQIQQRKQMLLSRFGDQVPPEMLDDEQLKGPVLDQMIQRALIQQVAEEGRLTISETELDRMIIEGGQFLTEDGKFDAQSFTQVLRRQGLTPTTYKAELLKDVQVQQLINGLALSSVATDSNVKSLTELTLQTRTINYLVLPYDEVEKEITVEESELNEYYEKHQNEYLESESVVVNFIEIDLNEITESVDIADSLVREQYEAEVADFEPQVSSQIAHILIEHNEGYQTRVAEVAEKLTAGGDFAELAKDYSDDLGTSEQGGDLGFTDGTLYPENFEAVVAELEVDGVSDPVETDAGTHFIKVVSREVSAPSSFEERKDGIRFVLASAEAESRYVELIEGLPDAAYNADRLDAIADEFGIELKTSDKVTREGADGLFSDNRVLGVIFSDDFYRDGNTSDLIELGDNRAVILKMAQYHPERQMELAEVLVEVEQSLKDQKINEVLQARASQIQSELSEQSAVAYGKANGLETFEKEVVQRTSRNLPGGLNEFVFAMNKPGPESREVGSTPLASGDWAVVELLNVQEGEFTLEGEVLVNTRKRLSREYVDSELASFLNAKREKASIEIY